MVNNSWYISVVVVFNSCVTIRRTYAVVATFIVIVMYCNIERGRVVWSCFLSTLAALILKQFPFILCMPTMLMRHLLARWACYFVGVCSQGKELVTVYNLHSICKCIILYARIVYFLCISICELSVNFRLFIWSLWFLILPVQYNYQPFDDVFASVTF